MIMGRSCEGGTLPATASPVAFDFDQSGSAGLYRIRLHLSARMPPMARPGRDRLSGTVEVDETYLGGLEEGVRGRQTDRKSLIAIAPQETSGGSA